MGGGVDGGDMRGGGPAIADDGDVVFFCHKDAGYFSPLRKASRSARSCGDIAASRPVGMSEPGSAASDFKSARSSVSSIPPGCRMVTLVGVSDVRTPVKLRPSFASQVYAVNAGAISASGAT